MYFWVFLNSCKQNFIKKLYPRLMGIDMLIKLLQNNIILCYTFYNAKNMIIYVNWQFSVSYFTSQTLKYFRRGAVWPNSTIFRILCTFALYVHFRVEFFFWIDRTKTTMVCGIQKCRMHLRKDYRKYLDPSKESRIKKELSLTFVYCSFWEECKHILAWAALSSCHVSWI